MVTFEQFKNGKFHHRVEATSAGLVVYYRHVGRLAAITRLSKLVRTLYAVACINRLQPMWVEYVGNNKLVEILHLILKCVLNPTHDNKLAAYSAANAARFIDESTFRLLMRNRRKAGAFLHAGSAVIHIGSAAAYYDLVTGSVNVATVVENVAHALRVINGKSGESQAWVWAYQQYLQCCGDGCQWQDRWATPEAVVVARQMLDTLDVGDGQYLADILEDVGFPYQQYLERLRSGEAVFSDWPIWNLLGLWSAVPVIEYGQIEAGGNCL